MLHEKLASTLTLLRNTKGLSKKIKSNEVEYGIEEQIRREYFPNTGQQSTKRYDFGQHC